jgi:cell pole-organizing protein PopZ
MNAPNSSSADRELDSLRRAQRAHEPSMEEILASIRSIIADDKEPAATSAPVQKPVAASGPQIVYSNDSIPPARPVAPPPEPAPEAKLPEPQPVAIAPSAPKIAWEKPAAVAAPEVELAAAPVEAVAPVEVAAPVEEEPFASPETDAAVTASFNALSASVAMHSSEMIENLTREMLRPMLKGWLDDNLPSLVERLVRAEIQRVARGGR